MTESLKLHAKSAALTFVSAFGVQLYAATETATDWHDVSWVPMISAISFTAVRAVLKALIMVRATEPTE